MTIQPTLNRIQPITSLETIENLGVIKENEPKKILDTRTAIYTHYTCATNTEDMKAVFRAVTDVLMLKNMVNIGMY